MFAGLSERLQQVFRALRNKGKLSEKDVEEALREVRVALLEADVNFKVVRDFTLRVKERAVGAEVMESLAPAHQVVKIVHDELTTLMGGDTTKLELSARPSLVMLIGLQGSGKTTTAAKLSILVKRQGLKPLMVALDLQRPAAIKQLKVLGEQAGVEVFEAGSGLRPVDIARAALERARTGASDVVIFDTAGRLHVDDELMRELSEIKAATTPSEVLLVVDAMTGQDAVNLAKAFNEAVGIDGVILTKLDGDTRGGAALSVRAVTGRPVKLVGVGEKLDSLEPFHPDRMASRILGMGDVLTLIEKAEATVDAEQARQWAEKLKAAEFTLEDFMEQLSQVRKMGPLDQLLGMVPGLSGLGKLKGVQFDEKELKKIEALISSMTAKERKTPSIIDGSRRRRIAQGSGTRVQDVNRLLKQYEQARAMMRQLSGLEKAGRKGTGGLLDLFR